MTQHGLIKSIVFCALSLSATRASADLVGVLSLEEANVTERKASKKAVEVATAQLHEGRVELVARRGLELIVRAAIAVLRKEGHASYANRKEREWNTSFSLDSVNGLGVLDLGDHAPLSRWVAGFYDGVAARIDKKWLKLFKFHDLKIFNYGIPVALRPAGNPATGADWGSEEYALHFVPVAAASIYWISNQACSLATPFPFSLGCSVAARLPRFGMEHFVAPKLSDSIYNRFN